MKKQIICVFFSVLFIFCNNFYAQNKKSTIQIDSVSKLFDNPKTLLIQLNYSNKNIKKETNDSTYIKSNIVFKSEDDVWDTIAVKLRVRGHNRLEKCYFPPIKIKIKKTASKGTQFEGNKKLKLVLPCFLNSKKNDYVVKEYMAYKLYEIISPYHFKTRMVDIFFTENKGSKTKKYRLNGFFIEDKKLVAKRNDGEVLDRYFHPMAQDPTASVQNALFQYMIGNTDYSTYAQHNETLIYVDSKVVPLPYDFDMSGLVNTNYSVVSVINNKPLPISSVEERLYRGFKRNSNIIQKVRKEFLNNKAEILAIVDSLEMDFDDRQEFIKAKIYITDFFEVIVNDVLFKEEIIDKLRTK